MLKKFKQLTKHLFRESSFYPAKELEVNQDTYQIRQLTTADIKDLLTVEREVYLGELPWTRSAFLSEFRSPLVHLYLGVFINEELVGFIGSRIIGIYRFTNHWNRLSYYKYRLDVSLSAKKHWLVLN